MFRIAFLKRFIFRHQAFRSASFTAFNVKEIISLKPFRQNLVIQGWVQSVRSHKNVYFVDVIDGSCINRLQVVIDADNRVPLYGSSIRVEGQLVESKHKGQDVELLCKVWETLGICSDDYPFCNRLKYSQEYIRQFPHLRPRTRTFASVLRIRNYASQAVYRFFQDKGFYLVHTPIITNNDCEGAGEVFSVQAANHVMKASTENESHSPLSVNKSNKNRSIKDSFFECSGDSDDENAHEAITETVKNEDEFFGEPAYLSVSGQLHLEAAACAMSRVYSFGPVFRAEGSRSRVHASEFYMIEAEVAFIDSLDSLTKLAQSCIKAVAKALLNNCQDEVHWINEKHSNIYTEYLKRVVSEPFVMMSYSEAVSLLQRNQGSFEHEIKPGTDFSPDHKRYLLKHCDNIPVIVTMFPSKIKPFYMKEDSEGQAYCFDVFAPFGGEICGGSLREDSEQTLQSKLESLGIQETLSWYLDLRKFGGVPLGGFGIGFDRMLQSILGIPNIRDVIPFPRRKNDCKC